jgi:succinate dehydrogenase flavin-adding protein (antitoxin of CptAB toxin-antitoxin module)
MILKPNGTDLTTEDVNNNLLEAYGEDAEEAAFAARLIDTLGTDWYNRERNSPVFNNMPYSAAYIMNQLQSINYAQEGSKRKSAGMVHEKVISFVSFVLKLIFKEKIKAYKDNQEVEGVGDFAKAMLKRMKEDDRFEDKISAIAYETFSQGDAFVLVDEEVTLEELEEVSTEGISFLDLEAGKKTKKRLVEHHAIKTKLLKGTNVILGNPEELYMRDQPRVCIEYVLTRAKAEQVFGKLKRWEYVPKTYSDAISQYGLSRKGLFDYDRIREQNDAFLVHYYIDKDNNLFNVLVNGVMMLPRGTTMTAVYPSRDYPIAKFSSELMTGSAYSRSVPMKIAWNSAILDFILSKTLQHFGRIATPNYVSTEGRFKTSGAIYDGENVFPSEYSKIKRFDEQDNNITPGEFNMYATFKNVIESQTLPASVNGEVMGGTATETMQAQDNMLRKLSYILDGFTRGMKDLDLILLDFMVSRCLRPAETRIINNKKVEVYYDFSIADDDSLNIIHFDDAVGISKEKDDAVKNKLLEQELNDRDENKNTKYLLVNPLFFRKNKLKWSVTIYPENRATSTSELTALFDKNTRAVQLLGLDITGGRVSSEGIVKELKETAQFDDSMFLSAAELELKQQEAMQGGIDPAEGVNPQQSNQGTRNKPESVKKGNDKKSKGGDFTFNSRANNKNAQK